MYLLHWPEYQDLIYNEIIQTVGKDSYPTLADHVSLPIVQAAIQVALRLATITPMGLPHKTTCDVTVCKKYHIPKGTHVMINAWNIHHSNEYWTNPKEYNPLRWLDDEGKYVTGVHKSFLPFSAGRRVCLGEQLAKTELFLIFSRFMRDFKIFPNTDEAFPKLNGKPAVVSRSVRSQTATP